MARAKEKIIERMTLYEGRVFGVRRDRVIEPGGYRATREVVVHPGSIVVLPVFPNGDMLLVRQYRHAARCFLWELVAGRIEPGESPLEGARRELLEETGYTARRFQKLMDVFPTPGFLTEHMVVFACRGLKPGRARPEPDERIQARRFPLHELERMMRSRRLRDTKSIAAILYYARFERR